MLNRERTMWEPGQSGNPAGRPKKGMALTDILAEKVDKEAIAERLIELAMERGDITALKYIYDRIDGKPVETVNNYTEQAPTRIDLVRHKDAIDRSDSGSVGEQEEV